MMLADDLATWRGPRGYVENLAHAIALAATCNQRLEESTGGGELPKLSSRSERVQLKVRVRFW